VGVVVGVSVAVGGVGGSGRWRQQRVAAVAGGDDGGGKLGWHHPTQQLTTVMLKRPFHGVVQDEEKPTNARYFPHPNKTKETAAH